MKNEKILEMLNNGEIEELKKVISEEIYNSSLDKNGNAKSRYKAMKDFYKFPSDKTDTRFLKPCKKSIRGQLYNCFLSSDVLVCTKESTGNIELYNEKEEAREWFNVEKLINASDFEIIEDIDFNDILSEAKSKGFKPVKQEIQYGNCAKYYLRFRDAYYKIGHLNKGYSIIDGGKHQEVFYNDKVSPLYIYNSLGIVMLLPVRIDIALRDNKDKDFVYVER
jgi:hypothetical protein